VNEIPVAAFAASVFEARSLELSEQLSYFRWHLGFLVDSFQSYNVLAKRCA